MAIPAIIPIITSALSALSNNEGIKKINSAVQMMDQQTKKEAP